ncbi:MAG: UbiH/UbiF family hydroxylase [Rhodobacteraceae bacterium]|nr:UbiH/UbiF family hydroxylase [Paracoccaceae bacterium]
MRHQDILISGGGLAGLTAALAFGGAGFSVLCVDPAPPVTSVNRAGADIRTTALLQPARQLLERANLWHRLAGSAAPLQIMRIIDAGGESHEVRDIADFDAADISDQPFGWNIPNWLLKRELLAAIAGVPDVTFLTGVQTRQTTPRSTEIRTMLSDGSLAVSHLLIAADGRNSNIREQAGIGVKTWRYGQKALAFTVTHPLPHHNVSTEIHRTGGPFTLVPLPDQDGQPASAVVWMERSAEIERLANLPVPAFEAEILTRSTGLFGPLTLNGRRSVWPIISQLANRLTAERTALIAEAAHVVPPIGAQGLNMSLADIACLLTLAQSAPDALGSATMLATFQRQRWGDINRRVRGIDLLNRVSMAENPLLRELRRSGLKTLHGVAPIRKLLMKTGLGAT